MFKSLAEHKLRVITLKDRASGFLVAVTWTVKLHFSWSILRGRWLACMPTLPVAILPTAEEVLQMSSGCSDDTRPRRCDVTICHGGEGRLGVHVDIVPQDTRPVSACIAKRATTTRGRQNSLDSTPENINDHYHLLRFIAAL